MADKTHYLVKDVSGGITSIGGLNLSTGYFGGTGFVQEFIGTGAALDVVMAVVGVSAVLFLVLSLGIVDLEEVMEA